MTYSRLIITTMKTVLSSAVFWFLALPLSSAPYGGTPQIPEEPQGAVAREDTLPDVVVRNPGRAPVMRGGDGSVKMKGEEVMRMSRVLGEADFINQVKSLPGVGTSGDYASGLSVDGADFTQSQYLVDGMPVTFPYRFGGIFSVFNPAFFTSMQMLRQSPASLPPRLGAVFLFASPADFATHAEGTANVGLMASSLTLHAGAGGRVAFSLGGRVSYIDQVYGRWLNSRNSALAFSFHDLNATLAWKLASSDILRAVFFQSADRVGYEDRNYSIDTRLRWTNRDFSISYLHDRPLRVAAILYRTRFSNTLNLSMPQFALRGPSSLDSYGARLETGERQREGTICRWEAGALVELHEAFPQSAEMTMAFSGSDGEGARRSEPIRQRMITSTLFGSLSAALPVEGLVATLEASGGFFASDTRGDRYRRLLVAPRLSFRYALPEGEAWLSVGGAAQPLHQVGFSELGLASDFWIGSCRRAPLRKSIGLNMRMSHRLPWLGLSAEVAGYWKRLRNQAEYQGEVLEVIDTDYDPFARLIIADGHNWGVSAAVIRAVGALTGELSYSYSSGKRHLRAAPSDSWDALDSEGHTFKSSLVWRPDPRWILSASLRMASGRRYTPVKALYVVGNNVAMEFGERNSARLPSYQRLDLGATWTLTAGRRFRHLLNLSLLNAYGHRNVEMQYFILDSEKGTYTLKRLCSLYRFLPSFSYTIEFK